MGGAGGAGWGGAGGGGWGWWWGGGGDGGRGMGAGGGGQIYIAVVALDVRAPEYYILIGIHNYVDMMRGYRYGHTNKFNHRSEQRTYNKAILTGMRHAPC